MGRTLGALATIILCVLLPQTTLAVKVLRPARENDTQVIRIGDSFAWVIEEREDGRVSLHDGEEEEEYEDGETVLFQWGPDRINQLDLPLDGSWT